MQTSDQEQGGQDAGVWKPSPPAALWPQASHPGALWTHTNPLCRGPHLLFCLGPFPTPGLRFLLCKEGTAALTSQGSRGKTGRPVHTDAQCLLSQGTFNPNLYCPFFKKGDGRLPRLVQGLDPTFPLQILVGELRFCLPCGVAKKIINDINKFKKLVEDFPGGPGNLKSTCQCKRTRIGSLV